MTNAITGLEKAMCNMTLKIGLISTFFVSLMAYNGLAGELPKKLHPLESYCVTYKLEGMMKGIKTVYSKNWGKNRVEITKAELKVPGVDMVQKENKKVIIKVTDDGQSIISINLEDNTGTTMKNPMFEMVMQGMKGKDPKKFGEEIMKKMGAKVVGEKVVAGEKCKIWELPGLAKTCITDDGITLESISEAVGMSEVATEIKRNDPGPNSAYEIGDAKIEEIDMKGLMPK
ncbi:hypothetical protein MYX76_11555 [Desulfobacterota bacterium AH_259_B03_O07]|nr:hypothetical protein [Desulfobacterota bacterium AH_259_B03_O07]